METVRPAAPGHQAAGELVDDDDFAVFDHVRDIALVERVGLDGDLDVVFEVPVFGVGDVADAEQLFDLLPALVRDGDGARLFVDDVVAGPGFFFERLDQFAAFELRDDEVYAGVLVGRLVGRAGDDERRSRLVDQNRIDLVDDAIEVSALHHVLQLELHVVAQVVEAELVVGAVGDVGGVGLASLVVREVVDDDADRQAEEAVDLAHPFGVALGEIVVHGDDVDAAAGERVQVAGKRGDQRLAFAGLHLGDLSLVEDHAADELDVEVAHADGAAAGLAHDGEGLGQDIGEGGFFGGVDLSPDLGRAGFDGVGRDRHAADSLGDARAKLNRLQAEIVVRERLDSGLKGVDLGDGGHQALDSAFVRGAEDFADRFVEHVRTCPSSWAGFTQSLV